MYETHTTTAWDGPSPCTQVHTEPLDYCRLIHQSTLLMTMASPHSLQVTKTFTFSLYSLQLHDYSCVYHMTMIISSCSSLSLSFWPSALSMPITFWSYLAIILDHLSYCPMLLSFILPSQPLIYLIIFVPLTFHLIVLHSTLFLLDVPLHLLLGIISYCPSYKVPSIPYILIGW